MHNLTDSPVPTDSPVAKPHVARFPHTRASFSLFGALLVTLISASGCIINSTSEPQGSLEVTWNTSECGPLGIASVRVRAARAGVVDASADGMACSKGFTTLLVPAGVHVVTLEGFGSNGGLLTSVSVTGIVVDHGASTTTQFTSFGGVVGGSTGGGTGGSLGQKGAVQISWLVDGQPAANACAARGLQTMVISILDASKSATLAKGSVACSAGGANLVDVPATTVYLQLDAVTADGSFIYGNATPFGPVNVTPAATTLIPTPIDVVDLRASVSLDWQFADGGTCGSHNSKVVYVEVADLDAGNKVVVPMNDPWAKKPCDVGPTSSYEARVIDMQFANPSCAIPPGARGLVICGIRSKAIGIRISAVDASQNKIFYGGSMKIEDIPATGHTAISVPLYMAPCDTIKNICGAP